MNECSHDEQMRNLERAVVRIRNRALEIGLRHRPHTVQGSIDWRCQCGAVGHDGEATDSWANHVVALVSEAMRSDTNPEIELLRKAANCAYTAGVTPPDPNQPGRPTEQSSREIFIRGEIAGAILRLGEERKPDLGDAIQTALADAAQNFGERGPALGEQEGGTEKGR